MTGRSRIGIVLACSYLGLFVLSAVYTLYLLVFQTASSEFSGLFSILLTLPWSLLIAPVADSSGYIRWYEHYAGNPAVYGLLALIPYLFGAGLNATILYLIGRMFDGAAVRGGMPDVKTPVSAEGSGVLWKRFTICFCFCVVLSFSAFLQFILPLPQYTALLFMLEMTAKVGGVVTLSYFGYAITLKKKYLLLGVLGFTPLVQAVGLIAGYIILWQARRNIQRNQRAAPVA